MLLITLRDITERMQAEEALREREESLTKAHEELELKVFETILTPDEAALQIERQPSQV